MEQSKVLILLDNGHGKNTPGKCSPDKSLLEYKYTREITKRISEKLKELKIRSKILVPEEEDISLIKRVQRANKTHQEEKSLGNTTLFISVHNNAAGGDKQWHSARGYSGWIGRNASTNSKIFAKLLQEEAEKLGLKGNRSVPKEKYWTAGFYVLLNTVMPAVLTENLFQDNKEDVEFLLSEKGKQTIVDMHVNAIVKYIKQL